MLFELTEEERMIRDTARDIVRKELVPIVGKLDEEERFPRELYEKFGEFGFMGMLVPQKYGGSEVGEFAQVLVIEEVAAVCAATAVTMAVHNGLASYAIVKYGTEEQKEKYLPALSSGKSIGAYALTEPQSGSDAASLTLSAVRKGDEYILNGLKVMITSGSVADVVIVFARTDRTSKAGGVTALIVERGFEGFRPGRPERKLGIRSSNTTEIAFEDCRVPVSNRLGKEGEGFKMAMYLLDGGRISVGAQCVGIMRACLEASLKYSQERVQFNRSIAEFQAIQWKLADMAMNLEAGRLLVYNAAKMREKGLVCTKEAAMAKLFCSAAVNNAAREAVQIHGGAGYTKEFPVERYFRDAKVAELYEGTSEVQRIVIARNLLREWTNPNGRKRISKEEAR